MLEVVVSETSKGSDPQSAVRCHCALRYIQCRCSEYIRDLTKRALDTSAVSVAGHTMGDGYVRVRGV